MISTFRLRRLFIFLSFLLCALNFGYKAKAATQAYAAYIYADYIGNSPTQLKYRVTVVLYGRCESGATGLPSSVNICVYSSCTGLPAIYSINLPQVYADTVAPYCPSISSSCASPSSTYPGYTRVVYQDTTTLHYNTPCADWTFEWYSTTARDNVDNIYNGSYPILHGYTDVWCKVNNLDRYNTSSPRFNNEVNMQWCLNQHNVIPTDPYDPNGDVLSSSLEFPATNNFQTCDRRGASVPAVGYSPANQIDASSSDPYTMNASTGIITLTPTGSSGSNRYALGMSVTATDPVSGKTMGIADAAFEAEVSSNYCGTTYPTMDTIPFSLGGGSTLDTTGGINVISVCPKSNVHFDVRGGVPASSTDVVYMSGDITSAPGATFGHVGDGTSTVVGTFDWTPTGNDVGDHVVTFTTKDSSCTGGQAIITRRYMTTIVRVLPSVAATKDHDYCGPTSDPVHLKVTGPNGATYNWSDTASPVTISDSTIPNPIVRPVYTSRYIVTSNAVTPCKNADTVIVYVHSPVDSPSAGPNQTICLNQVAQLNPTINHDTIYWMPGASLDDSLLAKATASPRVSTVYTLHAYDTIFHCSFTKETNVFINGKAPRLAISASPDSVCPEGQSQLNVVVQEQDCGVATSACTGSSNEYTDAGPSFKGVPYPASGGFPGDADIFNQVYGGLRMQIIYTKQELNKMGILPGYINAISFFLDKHTTDTFYKFTIKMGCTSQSQFSLGAGSYGTYGVFSTSVVYPPNNYYTKNGKNTFYLATPFYWDGTSNLVVDMCFTYPYKYPPNYDGMDLVSTSGSQALFNYFGNCCSSSYPGYNGCSNNYCYGYNERPKTAFTVCQTTNNYTYAWTPTSWAPNGTLSNAGIYNPVASDIVKKTMFHVKVTPKSGPANCYSIDSVAVAVDTSNHIKAIPENIVMCRPGYQPLGAQAFGPSPYSNLACGTSNPQNCPVPDTSILGDPNSTSYSYGYSPWEDNTTYSQMLISAADLKAGGMRSSGTIRQLDIYIPTSAYLYSSPIIHFAIKMGCTAKTQFANYSDTVKANTLTQVFTQDTLPLHYGMNSFKFQTPYNWDTTQNLIVQFCNDYSPGFYGVGVAYTSTSYPSWIMYYYYMGSACAGGYKWNYYTAPPKGRPVVTLEYCPAPPGNFVYTWKPGTFLSDSTQQNPVAYVNKSTKYSVYTQGRNNCWVHDSVQIFLPVHHYAIFPQDTAFCDGGSAKLTVKGTSPSAIYQWYQNGYQKATSLSCDQCASPVAMPRNPSNTDMDTTTYQLVITDSVNCSDTVFSRIETKPIPIVTAIPKDTTIDYGSSVMLSATGGTVYTWWPTATLSNPNIVNPIASPTEPVTYTVRGLAADGCSSTDTVHVGINYRGKLFVPTAFTPNGDGKNDHFRVANLTFEKIIEFHVFNRWGQEVFTGNDNTGWDGKWNNVDQDMGTYEYLIRVGFPDGFIETFKGNITLIR